MGEEPDAVEPRPEPEIGQAPLLAANESADAATTEVRLDRLTKEFEDIKRSLAN